MAENEGLSPEIKQACILLVCSYARCKDGCCEELARVGLKPLFLPRRKRKMIELLVGLLKPCIG